MSKKSKPQPNITAVVRCDFTKFYDVPVFIPETLERGSDDFRLAVRDAVRALASDAECMDCVGEEDEDEAGSEWEIDGYREIK